jgi:hypothetical protein
MFSPQCSSDEDFEFGLYEQKPFVNKMTNVVHNRAQRQSAAAPVPSIDVISTKKQGTARP